MKETRKTKRRHERELAFRALFQIDFHKDENDLNKTVTETLEGDAGFENDQNASGYAAYLVRTVINHLDEIDRDIMKYLRTDWSFDRLPKTEKTILRVACAEMRYLAQPKEIAINEAVELTKRYAEPDATNYINGILNHMGCDIEKQAQDE